MTLKLSIEELCRISDTLKKETAKGLAKNGAALKCLPYFITPAPKIGDGHVHVLELGGSNLRAALISIKNEEASFIDGPKEQAMPWERNQTFAQEEFLKLHADILNDLKSRYEGPLGYCFSFPTQPLPNQDATLTNWTKGIKVPNMIGKNVGQLLLSHLHSQYSKDFKRVCVINDSVAALFSGLLSHASTGLIGLIVGTGFNMATFLKSDDIAKSVTSFKSNEQIPVNLESGNLNIQSLTKWDEQVDAGSENKGDHLFEKAISGMYLGRIFKAVFPDSPFDPRKGAKGLVEMLNSPEDFKDEYVSAARQIYERSSMLVAASLAGLISLLKDHQSLENICIVAEGRLFWSKINGKNAYLDSVSKTLTSLLGELGIYGIEIDFKENKQATLIGTAIAALS